MEITIWGVITGAVLPLFGYLAFHWLATAREGKSRKAQASNDFRTKLVLATKDIPPATEHWDNDTLRYLPSVLDDIRTATQIYKYFKNSKQRQRLMDTFESLVNLVDSEVPDALSTPSIMYGGGQVTPKEVKSKFWKTVESLASFANET